MEKKNKIPRHHNLFGKRTKQNKLNKAKQNMATLCLTSQPRE
jgi:hypothetical protein